MIKSFQEINTNRFTILIEENPLSDIYNEVFLTQKQEEKIIEILTNNKNHLTKLFDIKCKKHRFIISDYVEIENE